MNKKSNIIKVLAVTGAIALVTICSVFQHSSNEDVAALATVICEMFDAHNDWKEEADEYKAEILDSMNNNDRVETIVSADVVAEEVAESQVIGTKILIGFNFHLKAPPSFFMPIFV